MKYFTSALFLICVSLATAQSFLPEEGKNWKEVRCNYWVDLLNGSYFVDYLKIEGDTTFNGIQYKKLNQRVEVYKHAIFTGQSEDSLILVEDTFFGGIREDNQKVYVAASSYDITMDEKLIYDFSAVANDTVHIWYDLFGYQPVIVDSVTTIVLADGTSRNKFVLKEVSTGTALPIFWIEGIGSNYGLLATNYIYIDDESKDLRCVTKDGSIVYDYEPAWYEDCLNYPIQDCESLILSAETLHDALNISVYPNPMVQSTAVVFDNFSNASFTLELYDAKGEKVRSIFNITANEVIIHRGNLASGMYYIRLYSDEYAVSKKVVIE